MNTEDRQYPIGRYEEPESVSIEQRHRWLEELKSFPELFRQKAHTLSPQQLATPYREGGWTALQVIHHVPDSHMNAYLRFRWALSEESPMIKAYDEGSWAGMADYQNGIELPLAFLEILHKRWHGLIKLMTEEEWKKTYRHPEDGKTYQLDKVLGMYVWHGKHHLGHLGLV